MKDAIWKKAIRYLLLLSTIVFCSLLFINGQPLAIKNIEYALKGKTIVRADLECSVYRQDESIALSYDRVKQYYVKYSPGVVEEVRARLVELGYSFEQINGVPLTAIENEYSLIALREQVVIVDEISCISITIAYNSTLANRGLENLLGICR